jgi:hypothetical protein
MKGALYSSIAATCALAACTPVLDWREVHAEGSGAVALFPCKPASHARQLSLASSPVRLELHACTTGGLTWALAFADMRDPSLVGPALIELRSAAASNLAASAARALPLHVEGATPNPSSKREEFAGRLPDGRAVVEQVAVFAKGTRVYQATVLGSELQADAADAFFAGLSLPP